MVNLRYRLPISARRGRWLCGALAHPGGIHQTDTGMGYVGNASGGYSCPVLLVEAERKRDGAKEALC
jgi:hypothetical protein